MSRLLQTWSPYVASEHGAEMRIPSLAMREPLGGFHQDGSTNATVQS